MTRLRHDAIVGHLVEMHYLASKKALRMKCLLFLVGLVGSVLCLAQDKASASEYRKCNIRIMVVADGMTESEVVGARFWAWGRDDYASQTWKRINATARSCAAKLYGVNYSSLPSECAAHETFLNDGVSSWSGITGLKTSRVHELIKQTLCANYPKGKGDPRTVSDKRVVRSLFVNIRPVGNSRACKSQTVIGPKFVTLHCRGDGRDTVGEWFHNTNKS